jgi:hypothetical protein
MQFYKKYDQIFEYADPKKILQEWNQKYSKGIKFVNDDIDFSDDSKAKEVLQTLQKLLKKYPNLKFNIEAHTSSPKAGEKWNGSNEKLSQARAEKIVAILKKMGVSPNQIRAIGKGFSDPIIENDDTEEKQAQNRRVEIHLSGEQLNKSPQPKKEDFLKIKWYIDLPFPDAADMQLSKPYRLQDTSDKKTYDNAKKYFNTIQTFHLIHKILDMQKLTYNKNQPGRKTIKQGDTIQIHPKMLHKLYIDGMYDPFGKGNFKKKS